MTLVNNQRESNFELLRIFAMFIIVLGHVAAHGIERVLWDNDGLLFLSNEITLKSICVLTITYFGKVGVALFFLISGFFLSERKEFKKQSLIKLIKTVYIYAILGGIIAIIFFINGFYNQYYANSKMFFKVLLKDTLLPVSIGSWWFITSYSILFLMSVSINSILDNLSKKKFVLGLILLYILYYFLGFTIFGGVYRDLYRAIFYYYAGTFIKRYYKDFNNLFLCIILWIISFLLFFVIAKYTLTSYKRSSILTKIIEYIGTGIISPINAIALFFIFKNIKIHSKVINCIGSTTFGIYLLHDHELIRPILFGGKLLDLRNIYDENYFLFFIFIFAFCIFGIASLIDFIRQIIIKKISIYLERYK